MPQFDSVTFFNQLFWFTVIFTIFYFFILGTLIPMLSVVLKARNKKLKSDSLSGATLKTESVAVLNSYDQKFVDLSSVLVTGINGILSEKTDWLSVIENKPRKYVLPYYMNSLVQLFLKSRSLKS
jgi:hypothetical protein